MLAISTLLIPIWLVQSPPAVPPPQAPARELVVVVAAPVYLPDGDIRTETVVLPATGAGLVHVFSRKTLCEPASTGANEPADAAFGWRVASHIVTRSEAEVVVSLDWKRLWNAGTKSAAGPGGTVQLTLHPGDRIPLDHIPNAAPLAGCRAVGLGLEVKLARTQTPPVAGSSTIPIGATPGGATPVDAELWLTHKSPAGVERVFHQVLRLSESGGRFSFAATPVSTSRGELLVEMTGGMDRFRLPAGGEFIVLSINRLVTGADLPPAGVRSTTSAPVPLPGIGDTIQFDMIGATGGRSRVGGVGVAGGGGRGGAVAAGSMGSGVQDPVQTRSGGGARGAGAVGAGGRGGGGATAAQLAGLLEGHQFSLLLKVKPVG